MADDNTLKKTLNIKLYQMDKLQDYLEEMALKGWELTKIDGSYKFKKIEPKKLDYSVEYFKYSHKTDEEEAEFIKSCEEKGWKCVGHSDNIYVFKGNTEFPSPINIDRNEQRRAIMANYALLGIFTWILSPAVQLFAIYNMGITRILTRYNYLGFFILFLYLIITVLIDIFNFVTWCIKSKRDRENSSKKYKNIKLDKFSKVKTIFFVVSIGLIIFSIIYSRNSPEIKNAEKEQLPITLETMGENPESERDMTYEENSTFLASEISYTDSIKNGNYDDISIKYKIFKNKSSVIIDLYVFGQTHGMFIDGRSKGNPTEWGAKAIYSVQDIWDNIVVVYDDEVFVYQTERYNAKLTAENIASIRKALGH